MDIDLLLAISHHLVVFLLIGIFAAEFALLRPGLGGTRLGQLARIDAAYGGVATLVIIVGVLRVIFGASGWEYYVGKQKRQWMPGARCACSKDACRQPITPFY